MPLFLIAARAVASLRIAQLRIMPHSYALSGRVRRQDVRHTHVSLEVGNLREIYLAALAEYENEERWEE